MPHVVVGKFATKTVMHPLHSIPFATKTAIVLALEKFKYSNIFLNTLNLSFFDKLAEAQKLHEILCNCVAISANIQLTQHFL